MFRAMAVGRAIKRIDGPVFTALEAIKTTLGPDEPLSDFEIATVLGWVSVAGLSAADRHAPFSGEELGRALDQAVSGAQFHITEDRFTAHLVQLTSAIAKIALAHTGTPGSMGAKFGHWCATTDLAALAEEFDALAKPPTPHRGLHHPEALAHAVHAAIAELNA